ncbi:MAG: hypothetical protein U0637_06520 [Phycisphaerales bacterium]
MPPTPATLARRAGAAHPRAVALAAASGVVLVGIVAIIAWRNHATPQAREQNTAPPTAPDIRDFSSIRSNPGGPANAAIGKGKGFFAQYVDKNDPTHIAGQVTADRSDPLPDRRYELTAPSAWFFQHDGRSIHVRADKGRFTAPAENAQPTDGSLEGNVRIRVFAATPDGARPALDDTTPELDLTTSRVSVDWALGQLDLPEDVKASTPRVAFHGRGVSVQFDPTTQRLDQLHVASLLEPIVIRGAPHGPASDRGTPASTAPATPPQPAPAQPAANTTPQPRAEPAPPPEERFYTLTASDSVEVRQGDRVVHAEEVLGWTRTLGNAFASIEPGPTNPDAPPRNPPTNPPTGTPPQAATTPAPAAPATANHPADDVTVFWKGPLLVQRVDQKPEQLDRDESVVQLASANSTVTLDDPTAGLAARGTRLRFAATREQIELSGSPAAPASLSMRGAGRASAIAFEIDAQRAQVRIPGKGMLESAEGKLEGQDEPKPTATIAWTDQAEFQFDTLRDRHAALQRATLVGNITGTQGTLAIGADSAIAEFFPPSSAQAATRSAPAPNRSPVKTVQLVGRARANDGKGGEFKGDTIHVAFDPPAGDSGAPVPRLVEASGNALATRAEESLAAQNIAATLAAPGSKTAPAGDSILTGGVIESLTATNGFTFKGKSGLGASGNTLTVQARDKTAHLTGAPAVVQQQDATLRCATIDLNGAKNTVSADGPGDFARTPADPAAPSIEAAWTRSMSFSDTDGALAVDGDARFRARSGPGSDREDSSVRADQIRVAFEHTDEQPTPPPAVEHAGQPPAPLLAAVGTGSRRVLTASGTSPDPANPVRLELRRGPLNGDTVEGRTLYVEGQSVSADNRTRTVHVPGPGKLLNSDHRPDLEHAVLPATGSRETQDGALPGSSKGDALFTWRQNATLDLSAGSANLEGSVRMVHRRLADSALTELECDHLTAAVEEDLKTRRLSSARAEGNVWARSQGREMTSQIAIYNAPLGILEATDTTGGDVLVSDPRSGEPLAAKAIRWDLAKGRIEIIDPSALSGPR